MIQSSQRFRDGGQRIATGIALGRILHPFEKRVRQMPAQRHSLQASHGIRRGCGDMIALMQ